ncbi:GNAT family N-acetyltransferase [Jatrophihabitans endophyticus]|uniref:GNAT family N-acetyltransferase n=1 Tax=Jatrophihabitans endophyticus TaxID=1206085 RepID=UPI0013566679|nr:GNAT family N-acetyltransferase [Jatrophihabitans endophyticus]
MNEVAPGAGWHDALHRAPTGLPAGAGQHVLAGVPVGVVVTDTDPTSLPAQWSADREVALAPAGELAPDRLHQVLPAFVELAASLADRPTAAVLSLPSRDVDSARVARGAGFAPTSVLAVADLRAAADPPAGAVASTVRDAAPDDIAAVAALWCEQADYEARVGTLRVSAAIRTAIDAAAEAAILGADTVLLAADTDGTAVGVVIAAPPSESGWAGTRLVLAPVSYLTSAATAAGVRGRGHGGALVRELHRRHRHAGVVASVLHYSAYNPLSVPFWSRQGYRPLVTSYARTVR